MKGDMVDVIYSSEGFNGRGKPRYALKCESWSNAYWDIVSDVKSDARDFDRYRVNITPCRPEEIYKNSMSAKEFIKRCEDGEFGAFPKKYNWETQMFESLEDEHMFGRSKKALEIIENGENNRDILASLHDEFVPDSGIADTVGGEVVRAINRIMYRWYNDGDQIGWDYGIETVNSSYQYLIEKNIIVDNFDESAFTGDYAYDKDEYDSFLRKLMKQVIDTLHNRPELFDEKNEDDSRDDYRYAIENQYEEEDYDDEDEYWDEDYEEDDSL